MEKDIIAGKSSRLILVTGCGRSGTKYTSFLLAKLGLDVPHERLGKHGIASWSMAVPAEKRPFGPPSSQVSYEHIFHQVRDPLSTIASAMTFNDISWNFISEHIECSRTAPRLVQAAKYWLHWNEQAERIATWRYRIEDLHGPVLDLFCDKIGVANNHKAVEQIPLNFNTRKHGRLVHLAEESFRRIGENAPCFLKSWMSTKPSDEFYVTWEVLEEADRDLCARLKAKAIQYGYCVD
jgi:hypothetical protein